MTGRMYLRKSRGEEADPELLAAHRSILIRLAEADETALPDAAIIEEVGSADNLADRPRFRALLAELQALPPPVALYCMDIDRLTKGPLPDRAAIYVTMVTAGVLIRTPSRWYDLTKPDDELMFELKALFGRQENAAHHRRVKAKWDEMTRKGVVLTGSAGTGYRWDKNIRNFVEAPEEASLVRALFREAVDLSTYQLGQKYGMRASSILRILRNPTYTGWPARHCQQRRYEGRKKSTGTGYLRREEWTWPEQPGTYPALVTREQFELVQQALRNRHRVGEKTGTTEAWCRDVLQFEGEPGHIHLGSHGREQERYLTYVVKGNTRLYVDRAIVHEAAHEAIVRVLATPGLAAAALEAQAELRRQSAPPIPGPTPDMLRAELAELRRQLDELLAREIATRDTEMMASIQRLRAAHRDRIDAVTRDLRRTGIDPSQQSAINRLLEESPGLFSDGRRLWARLSEKGKRLAARVFLARLVVRITPQKHPTPYLREVVLIEYQPWLKNISPDLAA